MRAHSVMRASRVAAVAAVWMLASGAIRGDQQPSPSQEPDVVNTPTFRTGVRYVEVDAVIRDRDGKLVTDLTREDFELFEDDKRQEIDRVTMVVAPSRRASGVPAPTLLRTTGAPLAGRAQLGRMYVMVLDSGPEDLVRRVARDFVRHSLSAGDVMAVMHVGRPAATQPLTANSELLLAAVDRYVPRGGATKESYRTLKEVAVNLNAVTGRRKSILFVSAGFNLWARRDDIHDWWREVNDATRTASEYNVPIHAISTAGLLSAYESFTESASYDQQSSMRLIAEDTGGMDIVNTNNYSGNLERLVEQDSVYYVLGYYSSLEADGRFHATRVQVKRDRLQVRARKGFRTQAPEVKARAVGMPDGLSREARALLRGAGGTEPTLAVATVTRVFRGTRFNGEVLVDTQLPATGLTLEGAQHLEYSVIAVDRWGRVCGSDRHWFSLDLKPETRQRIEQHGIRLFSRMTLPRGTYEVRVALRQDAGRIGIATSQVEVPDFTSITLAFSDLLVASASGDGDPLTFSSDSLLRRGLPALPTRRTAFSADEHLSLFGEVYDTHWLLTPSVAINATIVDEEGRVLVRRDDTLKTAPGGASTMVGRMPLAGLRPGAYVLNVEAYSEGTVPASGSQQYRFNVIDR